jgi:hypothetical protein
MEEGISFILYGRLVLLLEWNIDCLEIYFSLGKCFSDNKLDYFKEALVWKYYLWIRIDLMNKWFKIGVVLLLLCFFADTGNAKGENCSRWTMEQDTVVFVDTNLHVNLDEVRILRHKRKKRKHYRSTKKYWRMVRNIRIVYPYAQAATKTIEELSGELAHIESKKERRKLIRSEYKGLMKEYKKPLMKLKISQGKLLMKLIDRETGSTSYKHLKELKGSVTAVFWQSVASMFGSSLKAEYDPLGDDWMVEEILDRMKRNEIRPPKKLPEKKRI